MICKSCNHYNKDTASVCRFCGARLQEGPVKAEDFLKNSQPVRRSNSLNNDAPKGEDFLGGNSVYKNNRASFGNAAEQQKRSPYYQGTNSIPKRRNVSDDNPRSSEVSRDETKVRPKSSTLRNDTAKPVKSNVFLHSDTDNPESREDQHSSDNREAKEKTAVFQESLFNKKFSSTLIFLSFVTLVFIIAFSFVFIGKNYSDNSPSPSPSHSAAISSPTGARVSPTAQASVSPATTAVPIATTKPE
jgi:hypothetical protein